jgi:RNA polymerase sigma-70 factor (ECF subfamily)
MGLNADNAIVRRVLDGDREAFSEIVLTYQEYVYNNVLGQVGDEEVAYEVTQDTFIRGFKYLRSFRGDSTLKTWLTRIALNVVKDYFSSRKATFNEETFNTAEHEVTDGGEESREKEELHLRLREAISKIGERGREVLVMKFIDGLSYQEIASKLQIPLGTVSSRMTKAIAELKVKMEG